MSTVGYGDFSPKTKVEKLVGVVVMLFGIAFFSNVTTRIIDIVQSRFGNDEDFSELQNWITVLRQFTFKKQPLPKNILKKIERHFAYISENDRLGQMDMDTDHMKSLPRTVRHLVMTNYLFSDVFFVFRKFFNTYKYRDSKFLYEIGFGFQPREFDVGEIIYEEEDEASEIYFIIEGECGIKYQLPGTHSKLVEHAKYMKKGSFIGDYYVCNHRRSEFTYTCTKPMKCYSLGREFLTKLFEKYHSIGAEIKNQSLWRHKKCVRKPILELREKELALLNRTSVWKEYTLVQRNGQEDKSPNIEDDNEEKLLSEITNHDIQNQISHFTANIEKFALSCDKMLDDLVDKIKADKMKKK